MGWGEKRGCGAREGGCCALPRAPSGGTAGKRRGRAAWAGGRLPAPRLWRGAPPTPSEERPAARHTSPPPLSYWLALPWCERAFTNKRPAGPPSHGKERVDWWRGAGQSRPRPPPVKHRVAGKGGGGWAAAGASGGGGGMSASPMELLKKWLGHPEDIYNLLRFKMGGYRAVMPRIDPVSGTGCASVLSFGVPAGGAVEWGPGGGGRGGGGLSSPCGVAMG